MCGLGEHTRIAPPAAPPTTLGGHTRIASPTSPPTTLGEHKRTAPPDPSPTSMPAMEHVLRPGAEVEPVVGVGCNV